MEVIIKSSVGLASPTTLECQPGDKIGTLLNRASADQGITDSNTVALSLNGKILDNEKRVKEYGIKDGDSLHLVPSHRGVGASSPSSFSVGKPKGKVPIHFRNRIAREARMIRVNKIPLVMDINNPYHWVAKVRGNGTWAGQDSYVHIFLSKDYPRRVPKIFWKTKLAPKHPNIFPETTGWVCISSLDERNWRTTQGLANIYYELIYVMDHPHYHRFDRKPGRFNRINTNRNNSNWNWSHTAGGGPINNKKGFFDQLKSILGV
jgi:ubiquitin-protein ligase